MTISFEIPKDLEQQLRTGRADLSDQAREAFLVDLYRDDIATVDPTEAPNACLVQQLYIGPHVSAHWNGITPRFHLLSPPVQYSLHVPVFGRSRKDVANLWIGRRRFPCALELPRGL
jgi:hypothetical protein